MQNCRARLDKVQHTGSVYALAMDPQASLLVAGSPSGHCFMIDPRSGTPVGSLAGHSDNIR